MRAAQTAQYASSRGAALVSHASGRHAGASPWEAGSAGGASPQQPAGGGAGWEGEPWGRPGSVLILPRPVNPYTSLVGGPEVRSPTGGPIRRPGRLSSPR